MTVLLDGRSLTPAAVAEFARSRGPWRVELDAAAMARIDEVHGALADAAERTDVYGLTTGVGANRSIEIAPAHRAGQAMRLLHSHVGGVGPIEPDDVVRAMMVTRLNQLLGARSGIDRAVVEALARLLGAGTVPVVHGYGAVGTGDLGALAELGLVLAGERPGASAPVAFATGDALALLSSSALTVARAALATVDLARIVDAATGVGALSLLALRGSGQPFAPAVNTGVRPGQRLVAEVARRLTDGGASSDRVQDPYGLRTIPAVHGAAVDAVTHALAEVSVELNTGVENPMATEDGVFHHGNFQLASLAAALDALRLSVVQLATLSLARLAALVDPALTGLPPFLAGAPAGSSGVMALEYLAHDAVAELRARSLPVGLGAAPLWLTGEEHASFATQAARRAAECVEPLSIVLAAELVAAVRALRMAPERVGGAAKPLVERAWAELAADLADRPLDADMRAAVALLPTMAAAAQP